MRDKRELIRDLIDASIFLTQQSERCVGGPDYEDEVDVIRDAIVYIVSDGNPPDEEE